MRQQRPKKEKKKKKEAAAKQSKNQRKKIKGCARGKRNRNVPYPYCFDHRHLSFVAEVRKTSVDAALPLNPT